MKKLFVTGISGFLGWHITKAKQQQWQLIGTYKENALIITNGTTIALDLTESKKLQESLENIQPDAILHLAALSNPNYCEQHPDASYAVNVKVGVELASYAAQQNIPFVFTSTDLVFDGKAGNYTEAAPIAPVNQYGQHKAEAERAIQELYPAAIIARLPLLYGLTGRPDNFMFHWLRKLKEGETVPAFSDEFRTPGSGLDIAKGLFQLLEANQAGIWHLAGPERISRYDFAIKMAKAFSIPEHLIIPSLQKDVKMPAARPADVSMAIEKVTTIGYRPRPIEENLVMIREQRTVAKSKE